jgi:hypothetical protein
MLVDPTPFYNELFAAHSGDAAAARRRASGLSWARLLAFGASVVSLSFVLSASSRPGLALLAATTAAFVILVAAHRRAAVRATIAERRARACADGTARATRDWANVPPARTQVHADAGLNVAAARDLDVVGDVSLLRLLDVASPALGGARLVAWLLGDPPDGAALERRRDSVAALAQSPTLLVDAAVLGRAAGAGEPSRIQLLISWWQDKARIVGPVVYAAGVLGSVGMIAFTSLLVTHLIGVWAVKPISILLLVNLTASGFARVALRRHLRGVEGGIQAVRRVRESAALIAAAADVDGRFGDVQRHLRTDGLLASLVRLERLLSWNELQYSPMMHWAVNALVAYDVHLARQFDRWRGAQRFELSEWLDLIADAEALMALATLSFENPHWCRPGTNTDGLETVVAEEMGHPLLAADVSVKNSIALLADSDIVVVSGSNMAGKTTFLRALGLNALLAQTGAPVCARHFALQPIRLRTCVRVEDDLSRGVSLFFAEVTRLRAIAEEADRPGPRLLFLLDEILHGTNARDRREASRLVLRRLAAAGAVGVITTHDPELGDGLLLQSPSGDETPVRHFHFQEKITGEGFEFDYRLRPGPATSANALAILRNAGFR